MTRLRNFVYNKCIVSCATWQVDRVDKTTWLKKICYYFSITFSIDYYSSSASIFKKVRSNYTAGPKSAAYNDFVDTLVLSKWHIHFYDSNVACVHSHSVENKFYFYSWLYWKNRYQRFTYLTLNKRNYETVLIPVSTGSCKHASAGIFKMRCVVI